MARILGLTLLGLTLLSLSACGGGAGGNGGGGGGGGGPYTIGGTVTGLSGAKLILMNNGADTLTVTGNGSFTFANPVSSGGKYNITIDGEPLNPIQFCVAGDGSGTAQANVTSVRITCTTPSGKTLYSFGNPPDGSSPRGKLVSDGFGNLYGTTSGGGSYGFGTVFKLTPSQGQWAETVLYSFCPPQTVSCADGAVPYAGMVFDSTGNLYGTTYLGGAYGNLLSGQNNGGVVFQLTPSGNGSWTETVLHSFGNGTEGNMPFSGVVFDKQGNLYGTTLFGGINNNKCYGGCGIVYELSPGVNGQWTESVIYELCQQANCGDGYGPGGGVVFDPSGNLYGTAYNGGNSFGDGTVFELTPNGNGKWNETTLYQFQGGIADGANPQAGVVLDNSGNLYGTTEYGYAPVLGGGFNNGIAFELVRGSAGKWTENLLYGFCLWDVPDACHQYSDLVLDKSGNLYGTAGDASALGQGAVFSLTPGAANSAWNEVPLHPFGGGSEGGNPSGGLIFDQAGNLYGTTIRGGANGNGVIFEVTP